MTPKPRKAEPTVQNRQTDKDPAEKALFAFTDGSVLAEELGGGARHHRKAEPTVQNEESISN
ncbi:hypothetical protein RFW18_01160 [Metabacillus idriensis]|uniref:hypothetical protein n=1 Tax=Metabacillus idriensis TaxID=324768 RepID=UPI0028145B75|nr:hypothetical protein [Metabacillus idriensis]MDR0136336.1 hypothetical protein [Metabacillus idriensis]